jgi:Do/DeqQ family serine protease
MDAMHNSQPPHRGSRHRARRGLFVVLAAATFVALGWYGAQADVPGPGTVVRAAGPGTTDVPAVAPASARTSYADAVDRATPAVVTIWAEKVVKMEPANMLPDDPLFRRFFGDRLPEAPPEQRQGGVGSGVIVDPNGYVLTNHHVVDGAETLTVELSDRRRFEAKVVGSDEASDLAVLKIEASDLPTLPLADSDRVQVGDVVLALGNPLGVGLTVTQGIVSAKGRATSFGDGSFEDFLQTDAAINRGNSGGPLIDTAGTVVGINSQILSPTGTSIGIGFAIPANMVRNVMDQLIQDGHVRRGLLGVTVQGVTADLAQSLGLDEVKGALVSDVQADGPGDHAGVERGDVIVALDGSAVADSNQLRNMVAEHQPGARVTLSVRRGKGTRELTATLGERPSGRRLAETRPGSSEDRLGMTVEPLTPELARRLGTKDEQGLAVTDIDPAGLAARSGLREGDVIEEVDQRPVRSAMDLRDALDQDAERPALVLVNREGNRLYVPLRTS